MVLNITTLKKVVRKLKPENFKTDKRKKPKHFKPVNSNSNLMDGFIAYNEHGGYCLPTNCASRPAVRKLLAGKAYEPLTIEYMIENCGEGDIVHAGSFFGDFLPGLSSGISKHACIWAFEPNYDNFRCAQITTILNDLDNVVLKNFGLGEKSSTERLRIQRPTGEHMGGGSEIVRKDDKKGGNIVDIEIRRLDDCIPDDRNISIIQLDVEGYEEEALKGAMGIIGRCKPILILEDENDSTEKDWFKNNVLVMGYSQIDEIHNNKVFKCT